MSARQDPKTSNTLYQLRLTVRIDDINYGQHLAATAVPKLLQQVRVKFLQSLFFTEQDIAGMGIILTDLHVRYLSESFFDEQLLIELAIESITSTSATFVYHLTNQTQNKPLAKAEERIVFFDYARRKVTRMPSAFLNAIAALAGNKNS